MPLRDYLPSNMRLYASTMMGNRTPVDESYFPPQDIAAMRQAAQQGQVRRKEQISGEEQVHRAWASQPRENIASREWGPGPDGRIDTDRPTSVVSAGQRADQLGQQLKSLRARPGTIQYEDYPAAVYDAVGGAGWTETAKRSFTDPSYRAATSIGRAVIRQDPDGNNILHDSYDWNAGKFARKLSLRELGGEVFEQRGNPKNLGNILGNFMAPSDGPTRRPVRVNLGKW